MKIFHWLALGFIGCMVMPSTSTAQKTDYLVTMSNDTIFGMISGERESSVRIARKSGGSRESFSSDQVKLYHLHRQEKTYVSALIPNKSDPIFLLRIIEGPLELLEDVHKAAPAAPSAMPGMAPASSFSFKSTARLFVRKINTLFAGEVLNRYVFKDSTKEERKDAFLELIRDDPELAARLANERNLNKSVIIDYVKSYNFRKQRGLIPSAEEEK